MTALYQIANEYNELLEQGMDPELIADTLDGIEGEFSDKVEQLVMIIKNKLAYAEALKAEAKSFSERASAEQAQVDRIKKYIIDGMTSINKTTIQAGMQKVTTRKGVPSVNLIDETKIPESFLTYETIIKIDKSGIKEKLKAGEAVEGAELVAGKPSLTIK